MIIYNTPYQEVAKGMSEHVALELTKHLGPGCPLKWPRSPMLIKDTPDLREAIDTPNSGITSDAPDSKDREYVPVLDGSGNL